MSLFRYRVWFDSDDAFGTTKEAEMVVLARSEGEACDKVCAKYPTWHTIELVHQMPVTTRG